MDQNEIDTAADMEDNGAPSTTMAAAASAGTGQNYSKEYIVSPYMHDSCGEERVSLNSGALIYDAEDFRLPGKNGFDLVIARQYDSNASNNMDVVADLSGLLSETKPNSHNLKTYGLGYGWRFKLPSVETVLDCMVNNLSVRNTFLHLEDGRTFRIDGYDILYLYRENGERYTLQDVTAVSANERIIHPITRGAKDYRLVVSHKNGSKDYFNYYGHGGEFNYKLVAREDRFGNVILFDLVDYGGMTITDSWGRTVSLRKSGSSMYWSISGESGFSFTYAVNGAQLLSAVNQEAQVVRYEYTSKTASAKFASISRNTVNFTYNLLSGISHPSGMRSIYDYGSFSPKRSLGDAGGFREFYPLLSRKNIISGEEKHSTEYSYTIAGKYVSNTIISRPNRITEYHSFNVDNLCTNVVVQHNSLKVQTNDYAYGANQWDQKMLIKDTQRTYQQDGITYAEKIVEYSYRGNYLGNIGSITERFPYNTELNQTTSLTYGANSIVTSRSYSKDSETTIKEAFTLDSGGKVVSRAEILENGVCRQRTDYTYSSWSLTRERRYYGGAFAQYHDTAYTYDSAYKVAAPVRKSVGSVSYQYTYDNFGRVLTRTDGVNRTKLTYDKLGHLVREEYADGAVKTMSYTVNTSQNTVLITDERGYRQRKEFTPHGKLAKVVNINSDNTETALFSYTYDSVDRLVKAVVYNENSNRDLINFIRSTTSYSYDHLNRQTRQIIETGSSGPVLAQETYAYADAQERKYFLETKAVLGYSTVPDIVTVTKKDQRGRVASCTVGNSTQTFSYDKLGNQLSETDPRGSMQNWSYDYAGRILAHTLRHNGDAVTASNVYDALGNLVQAYDFRGGQSTYTYDALGRLGKRQSDFQGTARSTTYFGYDSAGNLTVKEVSCGIPGGVGTWSVTDYTYDDRNRLVDTSNRSAIIRSRSVYDTAGNRIQFYTGISGGSTSGAAKTVYTYDRFGNVLTVADPMWQSGERKEQAVYDKTGLLRYKSDRNGDTTHYTHDALGRVLSEEVYTANTMYSTTSRRDYIYARTGAVVRVTRTETDTAKGTSTALTTAYRYDNMGRLIGQTDPDGVTKTFSYDSNSNRTGLTITRNSVSQLNLSYQYDNRNRLTQVKQDSVIVAQYGYDANDNRTSITYPQCSITTTYDYNEANLVTSICHYIRGTPHTSYGYQYYLNGYPQEKSHQAIGSEARRTHYKYSGLGYLLSETEGSNRRVYEYDKFDNRIKLKVSGAEEYVTAYDYDLRGRLLSEVKEWAGGPVETTRYRYDYNGNQVYTERERLAPFTVPSDGKIGFSPVEELVTLEKKEYNGFNELVRLYRDGERTDYCHRPDGLRHSKTQLDRNGAKTTTIHHWDGEHVVMEAVDGRVDRRYLRGAGLIARQAGGNREYYLFDAHGDVVRRTDASGSSLKSYNYDAFGAEKEPDPDDPNPFRYCGEYYDRESGTVYLRNRDYNPASGRFTSEDPVRDGINWYAYCRNNPLSLVDPSGLAPKSFLNMSVGELQAAGALGNARITDQRNVSSQEKLLIDRSFSYHWTGENVTYPFKLKTVIISRMLGINPDDLMAVMASESGFDPQAYNPYGPAIGLIQFTDGKYGGIADFKRSYNIDTTLKKLRDMSAVDQLDYVYMHLSNREGIMKDVLDVYTVAFAPSSKLVGNPDIMLDIYKKGSRDYDNNINLDYDGIGGISKNDLRLHLEGRMPAYRKRIYNGEVRY